MRTSFSSTPLENCRGLVLRSSWQFTQKASPHGRKSQPYTGCGWRGNIHSLCTANLQAHNLYSGNSLGYLYDRPWIKGSLHTERVTGKAGGASIGKLASGDGPSACGMRLFGGNTLPSSHGSETVTVVGSELGGQQIFLVTSYMGDALSRDWAILWVTRTTSGNPWVWDEAADDEAVSPGAESAPLTCVYSSWERRAIIKRAQRTSRRT
jgi:hypothetical protein